MLRIRLADSQTGTPTMWYLRLGPSPHWVDRDFASRFKSVVKAVKNSPSGYLLELEPEPVTH